MKAPRASALTLAVFLLGVPANARQATDVTFAPVQEPLK